MKGFTFKQYETNKTTRFNFKLRCAAYGKDYKDFDEVFSGEKNSSGNKLFNYFYKGPNAGEQVETKNEIKSIEYYETHATTTSNFKTKCEAENKNYNYFKKTYSGEKLDNNKKYYYKYVGKKQAKNVVDKDSKKYYETYSVKRFNFKNICRYRNWNFEFFEEIDSLKISGGNKKFYYRYTGKRVLNAERYKYLMKHYETFSITLYRFKELCKKRGYNFDDFEQIESNEKLGNNKKFFYKKK